MQSRNVTRPVKYLRVLSQIFVSSVKYLRDPEVSLSRMRIDDSIELSINASIIFFRCLFDYCYV